MDWWGCGGELFCDYQSKLRASWILNYNYISLYFQGVVHFYLLSPFECVLEVHKAFAVQIMRCDLLCNFITAGMTTLGMEHLLARQVTYLPWVNSLKLYHRHTTVYIRVESGECLLKSFLVNFSGLSRLMQTFNDAMCLTIEFALINLK